MDLYQDQLKKPHTSIVECDFDVYFDQQVKELESASERDIRNVPKSRPEDLTPPSSSDAGSDDAPPPIPGLIKRTTDHEDLALCKANVPTYSTDQGPQRQYHVRRRNSSSYSRYLSPKHAFCKSTLDRQRRAKG